MITEEQLLELGFKYPPIKNCILNTLIYEINTKKHNGLSIITACNIGTPNEFIILQNMQKANRNLCEDLVVIHNYDFNGYMTFERMQHIIKGLDPNLE